MNSAIYYYVKLFFFFPARWAEIKTLWKTIFLSNIILLLQAIALSQCEKLILIIFMMLHRFLTRTS